MKKVIVLMVLTICSILFLLGFVEKEEVNTHEENQGIVISLYNIPNDFKNVKSLNKREKDIICATSIGLVEKDESGKIVPLLAKETKVEDNGIEYEFIFDSEKKWSNGEKITPEDYMIFFKELIKNGDEEEVSPLLNIYGAKEYRQGKITFEKGVAISKRENSLVVRLNSKDDAFLESLSKPEYRLRKNIAMWQNIKINYDKMIYSGQYSIEYIDKSQIKLEGNNDKKNSLVFTKEENSELAMASFEIGARDLVLDPPKNELNRLSKEKKLYTAPSSNGMYVHINSNKQGYNLQQRKQTYRYLCKGIEEYGRVNENYFELADGSYFRDDKESLSKMQTRKVSINNVEEVEMPEVLTLLGVESNENNEMCEFLSKWVKDNYNIGIRYTLVSEEKFEDKELRSKYNIILYKNTASMNNKGEFIEKIRSMLGDEVKNILGDAEEYNKIEEKCFNSYTVLPLIFYKENVAVSNRINKIAFDGNGNIKFSELN